MDGHSLLHLERVTCEWRVGMLDFVIVMSCTFQFSLQEILLKQKLFVLPLNMSNVLLQIGKTDSMIEFHH